MNITPENLVAHGFVYEDLHGESPYDRWTRDGVAVWNFNDKHWIVDFLDQAGMSREFHTMDELEKLWSALGLPSFAELVVMRRIAEVIIGPEANADTGKTKYLMTYDRFAEIWKASGFHFECTAKLQDALIKQANGDTSDFDEADRILDIRQPGQNK